MNIYDELRAKEGSILAFARKLGVTRQAVYQAANGHGSTEIRQAIAKTLGKKPSELFLYEQAPDSYIAAKPRTIAKRKLNDDLYGANHE